jgi:hypothetical protein
VASFTPLICRPPPFGPTRLERRRAERHPYRPRFHAEPGPRRALLALPGERGGWRRSWSARTAAGWSSSPRRHPLPPASPSLAGALSPALTGVSHTRTCALWRPPLCGSPGQAPRRRSPWNPRQQAARRSRRAQVHVKDLPPLAPSSTRPQSSRGNEHSLGHCPRAREQQ